MIYAAAPAPVPAFDLTHPAIVIADYLEDALKKKTFKPVPKSAVWMIEEFLQQALDRDQRDVDPVASAVSYELAASTLRASESEPVETDKTIRTFMDFLARLEAEAPRRVTNQDTEIGMHLKEFLEKLRLRGQSASYTRLGSCA